MRRREFIGLLGCAATWPLAAGAQHSVRVYRLGLLLPTQSNSSAMLAFWAVSTFDPTRLRRK
jgi:hypothetical protein